MTVHTPNTIESLRIVCAEKGWDGYDAEPMPEIVFKRAETIRPYIPKIFEACFLVLMVHFNGNGMNTERMGIGL